MSANRLIAVVVIIVAIASGIWWFMNNSSLSSGMMQGEGTHTSGTLAVLAARGGTWECDVSHTSENESTSGTVHVAGNRMRGDFSSNVVQVGSVESHMISDGEYIYIWSSAMPSGMKMKVTTAGDASGQTSGAGDLYQQNYDYDCRPSSENASLFVVPSDITFNDLSAMMPNLPTSAEVGANANGEASMPGDVGMNCAMCDQAPDAESKAQCKAALHCN